jgi:biotin-dependent carboxylase-like uncharacterized protein
MSGKLRVLAPGVLATIQDLGRPTAQRYGVPTGGAMDRFALAAANRLLGNPLSAAGIEITSGGASFEILASLVLALGGADLGAWLGERRLPPWRVVLARRGEILRLTARQCDRGARAYLAISGGIAADTVLGAAATYLAGGFGGMDGRALRAGDELSSAGPGDSLERAGAEWPVKQRPAYRAEPELRIIGGPHQNYFAAASLAALAATSWQINVASNRMGYRLEGKRLEYLGPCSLSSLGVIPGVIQVPPDGAPILLMADAQTTGGYPIIGVVIEPDLALAAQLLPGDRLHFRVVTAAEGRRARIEQADWLAANPAASAVHDCLRLAGALE